jgi:NAD(P)-dependent dehydrogenase (short-subunit alcohol dehydrogenase family)
MPATVITGGSGGIGAAAAARLLGASPARQVALAGLAPQDNLPPGLRAHAARVAS